MSFGMNFSLGIIRSTTGWRPADDREIESVCHDRPHIALALGHFGKR